MTDETAQNLRDELASLVEYLRFHTADGSADWKACLPEHERVLRDAEAVLRRADGEPEPPSRPCCSCGSPVRETDDECCECGADQDVIDNPYFSG